MRKKCPTCGRKYTGREIYCGRCRSLLEIEPNRCSAKKTEFCLTARLTEEDMYCPFCGEPSTWKLAMQDGDW